MAINYTTDITFNNPDNQVGIYFASAEGTYVKYSGGGSGDLMLGAEDQVQIRSSGSGSDEAIALFSDTSAQFQKDVICNESFVFQASDTSLAIESGNTFTISFNFRNNIIINANNATNTIAFSNLGADKIGKSGNIIINNPASVGSLAWAALPSTAYTLGGSTINFDTNASSVSIMSYLVIASDKVLINYVGNFKSYGT